MVDVLIKNVEIADGSGAPLFRADVAIEGDRIREIGNLSGATANKIIEGQGKVLSAGFIDMHSHADALLPVFPEAESLLQQGITTVVTGQCGSTYAPLLPQTRKEMIAMMASEGLEIPWDQWSSFKELTDYQEKVGSALNIVPLAGHGPVRGAVMGFSSKRPNEEQMEQMQQLVVQSMEGGAIGLSTGLIYPPGSFSSTAELIEVTKPVGERNGYYFSHIRGEADTLLEALAEAIEIGRKTGASVEISHYKAAMKANWWKAEKGLELIDKARAEGVDVSVDMYPYLAGSTNLMFLLPEWAHEGGLEGLTRRLKDAAERSKLIHGMQTEGFFRGAEWHDILISDSTKPEYAGRFVNELAKDAAKDPYEWVFDALLETNGQIGMIIFQMSEENVKMQLQHPVMMIGTDGVGLADHGLLARGVPHPRNFGTFPRVLGHYVREEKILTLEMAIRKMTTMPAEKLRLKERGAVKKGYKADLVLFDPKTIGEKGNYTQPAQYPEGITAVLVNGQIVVEDKQQNKVLPGKTLSRE
jgi:N-acyl-D-amino-acid deacylase